MVNTGKHRRLYSARVKAKNQKRELSLLHLKTQNREKAHFQQLLTICTTAIISSNVILKSERIQQITF